MELTGFIQPSRATQHLLNILGAHGYASDIRQMPNVDLESMYNRFTIQIKVSGFGNFEGRAQTEEAAMAEAEALFRRDYFQHFENGKILAEFEVRNTAHNELLQTDLKWLEVVNAFQEIAKTESKRTVIIQRLLRQQLLKETCKEEEVIEDTEKGDHGRFEPNQQKKKNETIKLFKTEILVSNVTIGETKGEENASKNKVYVITYKYLVALFSILEAVKKEPHHWNTEEIKRKLEKFISVNANRPNKDYKIIQVYLGPVRENGVLTHESVCIYFLGKKFLATHVTSIEHAEKTAYGNFFDYLKQLVHFMTTGSAEVGRVRPSGRSFRLTVQRPAKADPASIRSPYLLPEMTRQPPNLALPPANPDMGIVESRLRSIANVVNNFLSSYSAEASPAAIVAEFLCYDEFTTTFFEDKNGKFLYTVTHETLGSFFGVGNTHQDAMQSAHLKIYDLLHKIVCLVLSYRMITSITRSHVCWMNDLLNHNTELVKMKFKQAGANRYDATFTIEVLFYAAEVRGNSAAECKLMLYSRVVNTLGIFSSQITRADITFEDFKSKLPGESGCDRDIYRLPVPVYERTEYVPLGSARSGFAKLMELLIRFKQVYAAKKGKSSPVAIMETLRSLCKSLFSVTTTFDKEKENGIKEYKTVFVVYPLGSFTGNGNSREKANHMACYDVFNRLIDLKRVVHKLFKVDLNLVTHEEIEQLCSRFGHIFVCSTSTEDKVKVVLRLAHFLSCEGQGENFCEARMAAFHDMVQAIYQLRKEALLAIYREDNRTLALIKRNNALNGADAY